MPRALEYLADALAEAEAAAHWYAERSPSAALAFSEDGERRSRLSGRTLDGQGIPADTRAIRGEQAEVIRVALDRASAADVVETTKMAINSQV